MNIISFSNRDLIGIRNPHNDTLVVSMIIAKYDIKRILVNSESSANVIFYDAFVRMGLPLSQLRQVSTLLVNFSGDSVRVEGEITLLVTVGTSS